MENVRRFLLHSAHATARLLVLAAVRAGTLRASAKAESAIHKVADAHLDKMTVAVRYAFARGRKAGAKGAPAAIRRALLDVLPAALLKVVVDGGEMAAAKLGKLRVAGNADQPRDEKGQWTSTGGADSIVFHGTAKANLKAIMKEGIQPHLGAPGTMGANGSAVFATHDIIEAQRFASTKVTDNGLKKQIGVIFEVHVPVGEAFRQLPNGALKRDKAIPSEWIHSARVQSKDGSWITHSASALRHLSLSTVVFVVVNLGDGVSMRSLAPFIIRFDASDPRAAKWARERGAELAKDISDTTRERIAEAVANAAETGEDAYDEILAAIGDDSRAEMIARTETMMAANEGQRQAWDQAAEKGLLDEDTKRVWIATIGCCDECDALDEEEATLDGEYPDPGGDGPPLHPNCRCTEGISA